MFEALFVLVLFLTGLIYYSGTWKEAVPEALTHLLSRTRPLLEQNHSFFNSLSEEGKKKFLERCKWYLNNWRFIGMEEVEVTFEMKARIAAVAAQLTFGLRNHALSHFRNIKIFPSVF